jgi:hypothetical protein
MKCFYFLQVFASIYWIIFSFRLRFGSNHIFPEKVEEIRKNIHNYREFDLENKSVK